MFASSRWRILPLLCLLLIPSRNAFAQWTILQLTNDGLADEDAVISGSNVAWTHDDGNDREIYFYDGTSVLQLTDNDYKDSEPHISGSNVVWSSYDGNDYEIYLYDGVTVTPLTDNTVFDTVSGISGTNLIGSRYEGADSEIIFYDGTGFTELTNNFVNDAIGDISGTNLAWRGRWGSDYEIITYDGNTALPLTENDYDDMPPQVSGSNIIWESNGQIMLFDGSTITPLGNGQKPRISGKFATWQSQTSGEILYYDGNSTRQITNNSVRDEDPRISGANVVWSGWDGHDFEIYFYDGVNTTQLTDNYYDDFQVEISGTNVVWYGRTGEIYLATLTCDFDSDGDVDGNDYVTWDSHFGLVNPFGHSIREYGDADEDGDVDGLDFLIWQRNISDNLSSVTSISSSTNVVPEPTSISLAALVLVGVVCSRKMSRWNF